MATKTTFSNGRTMTAGFYNGVRLTNRQAQFVEMMRNGLTAVDCADSFGVTKGAVVGNLHLAMQANGIATMKEFRERLDLPAVKLGRRPKVKVDLEAPQKPVPEWLLTRRAAEKARDAVEAAYDRADGKAPATIPGVRRCRLTDDQMTLQLALRFNGDIHNAAKWLDWTVKECLAIIVELCKAHNVPATLDNFLKIT